MNGSCYHTDIWSVRDNPNVFLIVVEMSLSDIFIHTDCFLFLFYFLVVVLY